jgi:hypothetical protein
MSCKKKSPDLLEESAICMDSCEMVTNCMCHVVTASLVQALIDLQQVATAVLQLLISPAANSGLQATPQQLQDWLGQPAAAGPAASTSSTAGSSNSSSTNSSSVLHVSSYRAAGGGSPAPLLGGSEAHIDRGLLTVIADTGPGLQVGTD